MNFFSFLIGIFLTLIFGFIAFKLLRSIINDIKSRSKKKVVSEKVDISDDNSGDEPKL